MAASSKSPASQFPPISNPLVDSDGNMTTGWYQSLYGIWKRTGGPTGATTTDVATTATQALNLATTANANSQLALTQVGAADALANSALLAAQAAQTSANNANNTANHLLAGALLIANNLSDLSNAANARQNLALATFPNTLMYDGIVTAGLVRNIPIARAMSVQAGFNGTQTYCSTAPTVNAVFTVQFIRGGVATNIGTITLVHGQTSQNILSSIGNVGLQVGDTLSILAPNPSDVTLANVGITLLLTLN